MEGGLTPLDVLSDVACPVCGEAAKAHDVVDFNKACPEQHGRFLALSGSPVYYFWCRECGFCFAPQFQRWTVEEFRERIYNAEYALVDPDYAELRPRANAEGLIRIIGAHKRSIRHLDYGGGNGRLSEVLRGAGWKSESYDPFEDRSLALGDLGKFDLVTAYEVFEHVADVKQLMSNLKSLLATGGVILFSTLVSDGAIAPGSRLSWWYAAPRNGHISLFSRKSLQLLGRSAGMNFGSFSAGFHRYFTSVPRWAEAPALRTS